MKKIFCMICVASILLIGSFTAFANPHGTPDTEDALLAPPAPIYLLYAGK